MTIKRPFYRTCRQFSDGTYLDNGRGEYIHLPDYANNPSHSIRAFILIQKDLVNLFDFIEPADRNLRTYSFRIHELLVRSCIEVEANFKAILTANDYKRTGSWNMTCDYLKVEESHYLSDYKVIIPSWHGEKSTLQPFKSFNSQKSPKWYQAYNYTKHDRHNQFESANFENLLGAVSGLLVLLSSQFYNNDLTSDTLLLVRGADSESVLGIGGYFRIKFPDNIPESERYEFDSNDIRSKDFNFSKYPYPK